MAAFAYPAHTSRQSASHPIFAVAGRSIIDVIRFNAVAVGHKLTPVGRSPSVEFLKLGDEKGCRTSKAALAECNS